MRDSPGDVPPSVNFPEELEPTPKSERERCSKFDTSPQKTERQIGEELERFDVDMWVIEDAPTGSHNKWPGYVVRWEKDGKEYALVSDAYTSKKANARAAYYWIHETRMRKNRPVTTARDALAAAELPSGATRLPDGEAVPPGGYDRQSPAEILGVEPDATDDEIQAAYREKMKERHPDQNDGDNRMAVRLNKARDELMDGE